MKTADTPLFLLVSGDYKHALVAVYKGTQQLAARYAADVRLSAQLTLLIDEVLDAGQVTLADLAFIAATQGPGSFSHLRSTLSFVNGVSAASALPLVGIDTMRAWCNYACSQVVDKSADTVIVAAFDAYNKQIHYRIERVVEGRSELVAGPAYDTVEAVNSLVASLVRPSQTLLLVGQAALYISAGQSVSVTSIAGDDFDHLSACLAREALEVWYNQHAPVYELQPLHLKETSFKKAC